MSLSRGLCTLQSPYETTVDLAIFVQQMDHNPGSGGAGAPSSQPCTCLNEHLVFGLPQWEKMACKATARSPDQRERFYLRLVCSSNQPKLVIELYQLHLPVRPRSKREGTPQCYGWKGTRARWERLKCKASVSHLHTWSLSFLSISWNISASLGISWLLSSSQPESANGFVNLGTSFTAAVNLEQCTLSDVQVSFIKQDLWFHPLDLQMGLIVIYACVLKDHI